MHEPFDTLGSRVLVTGGAGFIGSHLCDALLARGHRVTVLDDLSTGRRENLELAERSDHCRVIIGSVTDRSLVHTLIGEADVVFHLAAVVGVSLIIENPARTLDVNSTGTGLVIEIAADLRRPLLLASTSEVYGRSTDLPFREDGDCLIGPSSISRWSYASSKIVGEQLALAAHRGRGLPVAVVRLFNTIGPRQTGRHGMVVPRFIDHALRGLPLEIYGDGEQTRCFVDVEDTVAALLALAACPAADGEIVNVGSERELSIAELARTVLLTAGREVDGNIRRIPYEEVYGDGFEDMPRRVPDTSKLRRLIDWKETVSLEASLERLIAQRAGGDRRSFASRTSR